MITNAQRLANHGQPGNPTLLAMQASASGAIVVGNIPISSEGQIADNAPPQDIRAQPVLERINEESEHEYSNKDQNSCSSASSHRDIEETK